VRPAVTLTSPISGLKVNAPGSATVSADASDADGTIARVEFFDYGTKIGEDPFPPYSLTVYNLLPGPHALKARAIDNAGARTDSSISYVTVRSLPVVRFYSPRAGDNILALSSITLQADAASYESPIVKVEYYAGSEKIGEAIRSPSAVRFPFTWSNVPAGTHTLTAKAFDSWGGSNVSPPVTIFVR
jgi:hypothetical protein